MTRTLYPFLLAVVLALSALAAGEGPSGTLPVPPKQKFQLGSWEQDIGYAQAVRVGNTLYVSGSVGAGDMPTAIKGAYGELSRTLAAYHLSFAHVVKENIFTTELDELKKYKDVRRAFYGTDFPAATWVQVNRLYQPNEVIEVEVIAVFPDGH